MKKSKQPKKAENRVILNGSRRFETSYKVSEANVTAYLLMALKQKGFQVESEVSISEVLSNGKRKHYAKLDILVYHLGVPVIIVEVKRVPTDISKIQNQIDKYKETGLIVLLCCGKKQIDKTILEITNAL